MNCNKTAVALLTFAPPDAKAWLYDLDQPDPTGGIMLCRKHANATVVPMSWQLVDARDPAWPGVIPEITSDTETSTLVGSLVESPAATAQIDTAQSEIPEIEAPLPSDTAAIDEEFAALQADLPITPRQYAEPQMATARSQGGPDTGDLLVNVGAPAVTPDPSLFELPLSDIPAVTPHPNY